MGKKSVKGGCGCVSLLWQKETVTGDHSPSTIMQWGGMVNPMLENRRACQSRIGFMYRVRNEI